MDQEVVVVHARSVHQCAEALELAVEEIRVALVGRGEVSPEPGQLETPVARRRLQQAKDHVRVALSQPAHSRVVLHVNARADAPLLATRGDPLGVLVSPDRDLRSRVERHLELGIRQRAHRQQRHLRKLGAELRRLGRRSHRQPGRPARQRRTAALHRTVPVAVGLHHRAQARSVRQVSGQAGAVSLHRPRVHNGDGAA